MNKTEISKLVEYSDNGPVKKVFHDEGNIKAQIVCLKAGQMIPPCKMNHDVLFYVIEGKGEIIVDNKIEKISPGMSVVVPKEAKTRSIKAAEDMVILGVQGIHDRK
jgi:quercetin dioxygenase-like cupin family protein